MSDLLVYALLEQKYGKDGADEIQSLRQQLAQAQADVSVMAKFITQQSNGFNGNWACKQCHPNSEMLIEGFECGLHLAKCLRGEVADDE